LERERALNPATPATECSAVAAHFVAGVVPVRYVEKLGSRCSPLHIKDMASDGSKHSVLIAIKK
jgi:hypothetical protein